MRYPTIPAFALAATIGVPTFACAGGWDNGIEEQPFSQARLFFELNDTDGDLGIHGKVDGDEWKYLQIEDPHDRKMLNLWVRGRLRRQGLTELFFESAEPTFDELDPEKFFRRFPEGEYDIEGYTLDGEKRESEVYLSHVIPAAPDNIVAGGYPSASVESCEGEDGAPAIPVILDATDGMTISWDPVEMSHAARWAGDPEKTPLGTDGIIDVRYYEVVVEIDDTDFKASAFVPPDVSEWEFPGDFFDLAEGEDGYARYKYELLVRINVYDDDGNPVVVELEDEEGEVDIDPLPGNKSAVESCFLVPAAGGDDDEE